MYGLTIGRGEESIRKQLRPHEELPDVIKNKPILRDDLRFYFQAFNDLDSTRSLGMAVGPIPWTAIRQYADYAKVFDVDFDIFVQMIRSLDATFMRHVQPGDKGGKSK